MVLALPEQFKYDDNIAASYAKSYKSNIQPQNGTSGYNLGDKITFNIPTRIGLSSNQLNSGLKFNAKFTAAAAQTMRLDSCGAHGFFQRLRTTHGSNVLEDEDNYGNMVKALYDLQMPFQSNYGKNNVLSGTRGTLCTDVMPAAAAANILNVYQRNSGDLVLQNATASTGPNSDGSYTFFINLVSILGALSNKKYFPNWAFNSAPITLELTLVDSILKIGACSDATVSVTLSNIEFIMDCIELNPEAQSLVQSQNIVIPFTRIQNFTYSFSNLGQGAQVSFPISIKNTSVKSIVASQRANSSGAATFFPYSSILNSLSSYQFKIGDKVAPSKPPDNTTEMFYEVCKCFGQIGDLSYSPNIDRRTYTQETNTAAGAVAATNFYNSGDSGSFYIGIDLESYSGTHKKFYTGLDTRTVDIFLNLYYSTAAAPPNVNPRWDIYCFSDFKLIAENGSGYVLS